MQVSFVQREPARAFCYNSNINKGPEVGLRQTFAATKATAKTTTKATTEATTKAITKRKKADKKAKGKRKAANTKSDDTNGYVSSDADPEVYPENDTNSNDQHVTLQNLSTTEVDISATDD